MFFSDNPKVKLYSGAIEIDNVLFLRQKDTGQRQLAHMLGYLNVKEESIDNFKQNIYLNTKYCQSNNIKYLHTVFPAKPVVFKETFKKAGLEIQSLLPSKACTDKVFYPIEYLDENSFYNDDTHNTHASFESLSRCILRRLNLDAPDLSPFYSDSLGRGDLGIMTRKQKQSKSHFLGYKEHVSLCSKFTNQSATSNSGFLDYIINHNALINKRLLIFGDSFFRYALDIYANYFKEVIYMRSPFIRRDIASNLMPDVILTGNAERYLVNVPNGRQAKPYFLAYFDERFQPTLISKNSIVAFKNLFRGRHDPIFLDWFNKDAERFTRGVYNKSLSEIIVSDLKSYQHVNYVRDQAIRLELTNLELAQYLMSLANGKRPSGLFIEKKLKEYNSLSNTKAL